MVGVILLSQSASFLCQNRKESSARVAVALVFLDEPYLFIKVARKNRFASLPHLPCAAFTNLKLSCPPIQLRDSEFIGAWIAPFKDEAVAQFSPDRGAESSQLNVVPFQKNCREQAQRSV